MKNLKKTVLILVLIGLAGATPLVADYWQGSGEMIPWEEPGGNIVYPWYQWSGTLSGGTFTGRWAPYTYTKQDTVFRDFYGSIIYLYNGDDGSTYAHCEGSWTRAVSGFPGIQICGDFSMEFNLSEDTCDGEWSDETDTGGTMWGYKL